MSARCITPFDWDFGWVVHRNPFDATSSLLYCEDEDAEDTTMTVCRHPQHVDLRDEYWVIPSSDLWQLPEDVEPAIRAVHGPFIYLISTVPELDLDRVKIGYTTDLSKRLHVIRTSSPTLLLLGLWTGDRDAEARAQTRLPGRIGRSENFNCPVDRALTALDALLGES